MIAMAFDSRIFLVLSLWLLAITATKSQTNLVPNPDFEIYSVCPSNPELVNDAPPWDILAGGGEGTPDYFNSCATYTPYGVPSNTWGYQYARSGNGYAFLGVYCATYANFREYIQIPLTDTLKAGKEYCVKFYVSAADKYKYAADGIGAYFSPSAVSSSSNLVLPYVPQVSNAIGNVIVDSASWIKVSGSFIATGNEKCALKTINPKHLLCIG